MKDRMDDLRGLLWFSNFQVVFWAKDDPVVPLLLNHVDYSQMVLLRSFPAELETGVIGNDNVNVNDVQSFQCLYLSYKKYLEVKDKWSKIPNYFEKMTEEGNAIWSHLKPEHMPYLESRFDFKYYCPGGFFSLIDTIKNYPSLCLEVKDPETGIFNPIGWVVLKFDGTLGLLYVEQKYRRTGLAQLLMTRFSARLFQEELFQITGLALEADLRNNASISLFDSLGWEFMGQNNFMYVTQGKLPRFLNGNLSIGDAANRNMVNGKILEIASSNTITQSSK